MRRLSRKVIKYTLVSTAVSSYKWRIQQFFHMNFINLEDFVMHLNLLENQKRFLLVKNTMSMCILHIDTIIYIIILYCVCFKQILVLLFIMPNSLLFSFVWFGEEHFHHKYLCLRHEYFTYQNAENNCIQKWK